MSKRSLLFIFMVSLLALQFNAMAWVGMPTPVLHADGKYLKDPCGNVVLLHGVAVTPSPWFNGCSYSKCRWDNYDVAGCLSYNESVINTLSDPSKGWYLNYIRLHIDPYWTNNGTSTGEADISKFDYNKMVYAVDNVIVPLINYAKSRGMYVILRPPGVCPQQISLNGAYYNYLYTIWNYLSSHSALKNADNVMFELANEPVNIMASDGTYGQDAQKYYDALKNFFQPIANKIRSNGATNILWIPGLGYQSLYKGLATNPVTGTNIGYAVHVYPGYWGVDTNVASNFQTAWDNNIKPIANIAPIAITETDWAPTKYSGVFGKGGVTGDASYGFGTKLKSLIDASGNISWNLLCFEDLIDQGEPTGGIAFGADPQACAAPCNSWFKAYASSNTPSSTCGGLINNGVYEIEFKTDPGKVLDLMNGTDANGTSLRPFTKLGTAAQHWKAVDAGNGNWRFVSMASTTSRCIDLTSGTTTNGTSIRLWDNYSNDAQTWTVTSVGGGYYKIVSKLNAAKGWDTPNCVVDGTKYLQIWDYYGTSCQNFKFNYISTAKSARIEPKEEQETGFAIFPNPAQDGNFMVNIHKQASESYQLRIFSLDGKLVLEKNNLIDGGNQINTQLKTGAYIVKVSSETKTYTKKLIIN